MSFQYLRWWFLSMIYHPRILLNFFWFYYSIFRRAYAPWFLSHHNKGLEWRTLKPPWRVTALGSWTDRVIALRQISGTARFYLDKSRKLHLQGLRACRPKDTKRRAPQRLEERESLRFLFLYVSLSLGLSCVNWASRECCLFYLRFSLWSSDLPLFYFCRLFPSRSFSHRHSGLLFPILLPNSVISCILIFPT